MPIHHALQGVLSFPTFDPMESKKSKPSKSADVPAKNGPLKSYREDDVSASIFARVRTLGGAEVTFHSVSFTRSYKGADGVWKYTHNFDANDLGKVITVAQCAAEFIHEQQQQQQPDA